MDIVRVEQLPGTVPVDIVLLEGIALGVGHLLDIGPEEGPLDTASGDDLLAPLIGTVPVEAVGNLEPTLLDSIHFCNKREHTL